MGFRLLDQYSLLHAAMGVVLYFWGVPLLWAIIAHSVYELAENTPWGMRMIQGIAFWPGGKWEADSWVNIVGDTVSFTAGWGAAAALNQMGAARGWYYPK
jgi:hypothetical protein